MRKVLFIKGLLLLCLLFSLWPCTISFAALVSTSSPAWSGYWWPLRFGGLANGSGYRGHPAPLEKIDQYTYSRYPADSTLWYLQTYYDPNGLDWYGHCGAWSKAAVSERFSILPSVENNIIFRVGDKKALLTMLHDDDLVETGSGSDPAVLHYWLLHYIQDQDTSFVAELDPSVEVWYYPVYAFDMQTTRSGSTESVVVQIRSASDNVHPDFIGTQEMINEYTYDLTLDGQGSILSGVWTGKSIVDHPQILLLPLMQRSTFTSLDFDLVQQIARNQDDELENLRSPAEISPGTYNLVLLNEDAYTVKCRQGDSFSLSLLKQPGSSLDMHYRLTDGSGTTIEQGAVNSSVAADLFIEATLPPYTLYVSQDDYSDPNIYTLTVDLKKAYNQYFGYLPKNGPWDGFALTNADPNDSAEVSINTLDKAGLPLQTVFGPTAILPGEKQLFMFSSLPYREHEFPNTYGVQLHSDKSIKVINLIGQTSSMASQANERIANHLILPETTPSFNPAKYLSAKVRNEGFTDVDVALTVYNKNGSFYKVHNETIAGRGTFPITAGQAPFSDLPDGGWIDVSAPEGGMVTASYYLSGNKMSDGLSGLVVSDTVQYVPHVSPPGGWVTGLTLINPNDQINTVQIHSAKGEGGPADTMTLSMDPYQKIEIELQNDFGKLFGDPLYRSILEVSGTLPVSGYFSYSLNGSIEKASFPLLQITEMAPEIVLPHYPSNTSYWWTGVGVMNPTEQSQAVIIEPYGSSGNLLPERSVTLAIPALGYEIFTVQGLFQSTADISFIKCKTVSPAGKIGGFYLYSGGKSSLLSGALMN